MVWSTGSETFISLVHVLFVAFDLASLAFQSQRRFEHVPQGFGTGFTVSGKVVQGWDELVTLMANVAGLVPRKRFQLLLFLALTLICVQDLEEPMTSDKTFAYSRHPYAL